MTIDYVKDRKAFGQPIFDFQNTRFKLAERKTEAMVPRIFLDRCIDDWSPALDTVTAAMKYWSTEQQCEIVDDCVQLHGGYGYILEYPIARMWVDARIPDIWRRQRDHEGYHCAVAVVGRRERLYLIRWSATTACPRR